MKASKLKQTAPRSSLARLVRRRCDRTERTVWRLWTTYPKGVEGGKDCVTAMWLREKPPTAKMLEKEMQWHPHGSKFSLSRERHTEWAEWQATPNRVINEREAD